MTLQPALNRQPACSRGSWSSACAVAPKRDSLGARAPERTRRTACNFASCGLHRGHNCEEVHTLRMQTLVASRPSGNIWDSNHRSSVQDGRKRTALFSGSNRHSNSVTERTRTALSWSNSRRNTICRCSPERAELGREVDYLPTQARRTETRIVAFRFQVYGS
jgi:hypothetical protein